MQVLVVCRPSKRIKGLLRSHGVEVARNVFVFDLTSTDMELLWQRVSSKAPSKMRATLVRPTTGKPGYLTEGLSQKVVPSVTLDGLVLRARPIPRKRNSDI